MKTSHFLMLIALCMLALTGCSNDDIQSVDTTPADIRVSFTTPAGYSEELTMTTSIDTDRNQHRQRDSLQFFDGR